MSHPQPKRQSSNELIDQYSVARFITKTPPHVDSGKQARAQVKRYK